MPIKICGHSLSTHSLYYSASSFLLTDETYEAISAWPLSKSPVITNSRQTTAQNMSLRRGRLSTKISLRAEIGMDGNPLTRNIVVRQFKRISYIDPWSAWQMDASSITARPLASSRKHPRRQNSLHIKFDKPAAEVSAGEKKVSI